MKSFIYAVLLLAASTVSALAGEEIKCRFKGLEKLYTHAGEMKLTLSQEKSRATLESYGIPLEYSIRKEEGHKTFFDDEDKTNMSEFLTRFEEGTNKVFTKEGAAKFLEIERPYYVKILNGIHLVSEYEIVLKGSMIESIFNFYDENGVYVASWIFGPKGKIYNFCIPE